MEECKVCGGLVGDLAVEDVESLVGRFAARVSEFRLARFTEVFRAIARCESPRCECLPGESLPPQSGFYLYRLWDVNARLLYVGVSTRLRDRLSSHQRRWGELVEFATWEEHEDARAMLAAEREAIRNEDPALNKAGVG
jgi:hypothetical protein